MIIVITSTVVQGLTFQISHPDWLLETNPMENKGHAKEECEDRYVLILSSPKLPLLCTYLYFQECFKCNNISYFVILSFDPGMLEAEGQNKMIACRRPKWMMFGKLFWNLDPN